MVENIELPPLPSPLPATYDRRVVLAYARAYARGLGLLLEELHGAIDRARDEVERCLDEEELPRRRAKLLGYEHAQVARMQGDEALPRTFLI